MANMDSMDITGSMDFMELFVVVVFNSMIKINGVDHAENKLQHGLYGYYEGGN